MCLLHEPSPNRVDTGTRTRLVANEKVRCGRGNTKSASELSDTMSTSQAVIAACVVVVLGCLPGEGAERSTRSQYHWRTRDETSSFSHCPSNSDCGGGSGDAIDWQHALRGCIGPRESAGRCRLHWGGMHAKWHRKVLIEGIRMRRQRHSIAVHHQYMEHCLRQRAVNDSGRRSDEVV